MQSTPPSRQTAYTLKYEAYLRSPAWAKRGRRIRNRDGNCCVLCAATKRLNVHHITYDRLGRERDRDLLTLCEDCHLELHVAVKTGKTPLGEAHTYLARERGILIQVAAPKAKAKAKTKTKKPQPPKQRPKAPANPPVLKVKRPKKPRPSPAEIRQRLSTTCHSCRAEVQPDAKHCPKCLTANPVSALGAAEWDSKTARRKGRRQRRRRQEQQYEQTRAQHRAERDQLEAGTPASRRA